MSILDTIQTLCAIISTIISFYAQNEVHKIKNRIHQEVI